ncbi:MAG: hypothetical protein ACP5HM_12385 [Anaerolineae bacterium]
MQDAVDTKATSSFWNRVALAGTAGYILYCFSENFFWTRPTEEHVGGYVAGWLLYAFLTFALFTVIHHFRARSVWALFLAGSVYGWLVEGVIMQTMYDSLPWQLSFTGLAWHALISVLVGWWYTRRTLFENRPGKTILLAFGLGLFYGVWSLNAYVQEGMITSLPVYARFATVSTLLLVASYVLHDRIALSAFQPGRVEVGVQVAFLGAYFIFVAVPAQPLALLILPPPLALTGVALHRNRRRETRADILVALQGRVKWWNYLLLLVVPVVAIAFYALALKVNVAQHDDLLALIPIAMYVLTAGLGFGMYLISWLKVWR